MNVFFGRWSLGLLIVVNFICVAAPIIHPDARISEVPALPPDTRCNLSVSSPVVDYGMMSRGQLQEMAGGGFSMGGRLLTLNVVCPYTRTMKLQVQGERDSRGWLRYGDLGSVRLRLLDALLDGNAVELRALNPMDEITESSVQEVNVGKLLAPVGPGRLAEGKMFEVRFEIEPILTESGSRVNRQQLGETALTFVIN